MSLVLGRTPNRQYNVARPDSLPVRLATYQRRHIYARFLDDTGITAQDTILDVGVSSDRSYTSSNYLEAWYPHKDKITAVGTDDASFLETQYPGLRFVNANGLDLPFENDTFDVVHASAVLEHVGSFDNQVRLAKECVRVARKSIFLTTPNRWFPVEFHTVLPLVHWLPKTTFRALMRGLGMAFFADEANLNLMTSAELRRIAALFDDIEIRVSSIPLWGWPSNLLLSGRRAVPVGHQATSAGNFL